MITNKNTTAQIVARQIEFQKTMNTSYETMYLAFVEEMGELTASFGFADWKKVERDEANIEIELADLAVFAINLEYYSDIPQVDQWLHLKLSNNDFAVVHNLIKLLSEHRFKDIYTYIFAYMPKLQEVIVAKQALNRLRQDYGYKEGTYKKMWGGLEDNTHLDQLYGRSLSYEDMYAELEDIYKAIV